MAPSLPALVKLRQRRLRQLALLPAASLLIVVVSHVSAILRHGEESRAWVDAQIHHSIPLPATRGEIRDRQGEPLAEGIHTFDLGVDPSRAVCLPVGRGPIPSCADLDGQIQAVADALELPVEELRTRLHASGHYVFLARDVLPDRALRAERVQAPWLTSTEKQGRLHPQPDVAAGTLGVLGPDGQGVTGAEAARDADLQGAPGTAAILRDARGRPILLDSAIFQPPVDGATIETTIDPEIQGIAQRAMRHAREASHGRTAQAVVVEAETGEVLALVSEPSSDADHPDPTGRSRLTVLTDPREPGSVLKVVTLTAAIELGLSGPDDPVPVGPPLVLDGRIIHDDHDCHCAEMSLTDVLVRSSNIGCSRLALRLGAATLTRYERLFGLGERTGVGLREAPGSVLDATRASEHDLAVASFGQGAVTATALQISFVYATLANGGVRMHPLLWKRVLRPDGTIEESRPVVAATVTSAAVAAQLVGMLREVVVRGTGKRAAIPGVDVQGKTGTSQLVVHGRYAYGLTFASFVGLVPLANGHHLVIFTGIDRPQGETHGGEVAAPAFAQVARGVISLPAWRPANPPPSQIAQSSQVPESGGRHATR